MIPVNQSARFYQVGGTLRPTDPTYIQREADRRLYHHVRAGDYCYVLSSRQMGKSSLMAHAARRLREDGVRAAIVDLSQIGKEEVQSAAQWYHGVVSDIARQFELEQALQHWWNDHDTLPPTQRLIEFFRDFLLSALPESVVVFVDEIDSTIGLGFADDFFAALRACFNARAIEERFQRLTFVLIGVATPNQLISDPTRTPFNIGHAIDLTDFTPQEAEVLVPGLSHDSTRALLLLERVLYWTGGHPYLTQALCNAVAEIGGVDPPDQAVDAAVSQAFLSPWQRKADSNLKYVTERLTRGPAAYQVMRLYLRVCRGVEVRDQPAVSTVALLKLTGVVKVDYDSRLRVRNRIYQQVFSRQWARGELPRNWVEIGAVSAAVVSLAAVGLTFGIIKPASLALAELRTTSDEAVALERYVKLTETSLLFRALEFFGGTSPEDVKVALAQFWERRAQSLDERAAVRLKNGEIEEACILAVAATVKRNGPLSQHGKTACSDPRFAQLSISASKLYPDKLAPAGIEAEFSPDGLSLIVGAWGKNEAVYLIDATKGLKIWSRAYDGRGVLLADGYTVVEIDEQAVRLFVREKLIAEIAMPMDLTVAAAYQARSTFIPVSGDGAVTPSPTSIFRNVAACLGIVPNTDKSALTSFGVSNDGLLAGFVINLQHVYKCDLETGKPTKLLSMGKGYPGYGFATLEFSPDKRLLTTVVSSSEDGWMWAPVAIETLTGRVVQRWTSRDWDQRFTLDARWLVFFTKIVNTVNWSTVYDAKDGWIAGVSRNGRLVAIQLGGVMEVVDVASRRTIIEIPIGKDKQHASFSPDARRLVLSGHTVRVFDLADSLDGPTVNDPTLLWAQWQRKLGLTLDQNDEPVPVWQVGFKELRGATAALASE